MASKGGIYLIRTRKPWAILGFPVIGRHNGYVGLTSSYYHRERQHLIGSFTYGQAAKCWSDLDPKFHRIIPLPNWRWLLHLVETLAIWVLCPVYNEQKQPPWNVRRIRPRAAERQRWARVKYGPLHRAGLAAGRALVYVTILGLAGYVWWVQR